MKPRILREILKSLKESLNNREPKPIESENLSVSKSNLFIAKVALIATIVLGTIGIFIAWRFGNLTANLANSQLTLQREQNKTALAIVHFDSLLRKTDTILDLNRQEQAITNMNAKYSHMADEDRFYLAVQGLKLILFSHATDRPTYLSEWDSTLKFSFLKSIDSILISQLDNPYLLSNKYMQQDCRKVRELIEAYISNSNFYPSKKTDKFSYGGSSFEESQKQLFKEFYDCVGAIGDLIMNLDSYTRYYRFGNGRDPKIKLLTGEYFYQYLLELGSKVKVKQKP